MNSILSSLTCLSTRTTTHTTKESTSKEVRQDVISTKSPMFMNTFLQPFQSMSVIHFSFLWIREDFIGKGNFLKLFSSFWIFVRVEFLSKLAISLKILHQNKKQSKLISIILGVTQRGHCSGRTCHDFRSLTNCRVIDTNYNRKSLNYQDLPSLDHCH